MNDRWDLSYLYKGFDDGALKKDLASLPLEVERLKALLSDDSLSPVDCLERFLDENEKLSARVDGLANFIMCTLAVDATNADACAARRSSSRALGLAPKRTSALRLVASTSREA